MLFLARLLFRDIGKNIGKSEVIFRIGVSTLSIIFALCHAFFLIYFAVIGVYAMIPVCGIGVACYVLIVALNRGSISYASGMLFIAVPVVYAILCIYMVGWTAGAQWYLMALIIPVYMMYEKFSVLTRRVSVIILMGTMALCYMMQLRTTPLYADVPMMIMEIANIFLAMVSGVFSVEILNFGLLFNQRRYQSKIANLTDEANKDPLTKMWNRRYVENLLTNIFWDDSAKRERIFIASLDIDFFKNVNDTHGYEAGDEILKKFAQVMMKGFRSTDVTARWGGEEFLVVLNDTDERGALKALENFKAKLQYADISWEGVKLDLKVTAGLVCCIADDSFEECIKYSNEALYFGKNNGRDKIINYREIPGARSY